ncbi:MAG: hypothetical protein R3F46_03430 [bacterium]
MPKARRAVEAGLANKGFVRRPGDHNFFVYFTRDGRQTAITTKASHGSKRKDIHDGLLAAMGRQCRLSRQEFLDLVDCPLSQEQYEDLLMGRGNF